MRTEEPVEKYLRPVQVRQYSDVDFEVCRAIYISNEQDFLPASHRGDFENELRLKRCLYLVLESDGVVVACGGIYHRGGHDYAGLCYGMVHRAYHRKGFGTTLLFARLALLDPEVGCAVFMQATSESFDFYRRFGFVPYHKEENTVGERFAYVARSLSGSQLATIRKIVARNGVVLPANVEIPLDAIGHQTI